MLKIRPNQIYILCCSLRISGHLPAAIVNGGGDQVGKVQFSEVHGRCDLDLDLESGHTAYHRASLVEIGKTLWTD